MIILQILDSLKKSDSFYQNDIFNGINWENYTINFRSLKKSDSFNKNDIFNGKIRIS